MFITGYSYLEFVNGASFGSEVLTKATPCMFYVLNFPITVILCIKHVT